MTAIRQSASQKTRRWIPRFAPATSQPVAASLTRSNRQYAELARDYDAATPRIEAIREEAHRLLALQPGQTVIDAGCGTGKSLPFLSRAVGEHGRVIAFEPCKEMLAVARERVSSESLTNVELFEDEATVLNRVAAPRSVDGVLLMFTHDLLQSPCGISAVLQTCKDGARIALSGGKLFSGPLALLNPWVEWRQRPYCTTFENYDAPWRKLFATGTLQNTHVHPRYMGIAYIAYGEVSRKING